MKHAGLLTLFLVFCASASAQQAPPVAYFVDTSGKSYLTFTTTDLPAPAPFPVTCFVQAGGTKAAIRIADDLGQVFIQGPAASAWDSSNNQGIKAFYGPKGGTRFIATADASVDYVTLACLPLDVGAFDLSAAAVGTTKLTWNASALDVVVAAVAEDSTSSNDTFAPGAGFTLVKNDGAHGFAVEVGSGNPSFSLTPAKSALIVAMAFQPGTAPQVRNVTLNVKLLWSDGTPVQAKLRFQQSFSGTWTDLTTLTLDAAGSATGVVPISLQQGDPVSLSLTIFDASGAWPQADPLTVALSRFNGITALNLAATADKTTKLLVLPVSVTQQ